MHTINENCKRKINYLFELSDVYLEEIDKVRIEDYGKLLGDLCLNRVASIAYKNIEKFSHQIFPNEFMKSLNAVYKDNCSWSIWYCKCIEYLTQIFAEASFKYAFLKGAYLVTMLYPIGLRTSNDIDILIDENDISECQELLLKNGFIQGEVQPQGDIIPATRREIVFSRMNYGETIPFCKQIENYILQIDLNFSLDFKPDGSRKLVDNMLSNRKKIFYKGSYYYTLNDIDFLIHLCCHLYKEATTLTWVRWQRDLDLYKFSDINVLLKNVKYDFEKLLNRIQKLGVDRECYYVFQNTREIYPQVNCNKEFSEFLEKLEPTNKIYLKQIYDPSEDRYYYYDLAFTDWFNCNDRLGALKDYKNE